jgi:hypothetical protein
VHDETKLPKYAQDELNRLRRDLAHAHAKLEAGPEDSDTFADPYLHPRPLGKGESVEFRLNPQRKVRVRIAQTHRGPELDINADSGLSIEPVAANAIRIR